MKVKDIKSKVAAKIAKGKAKVARKCGKGAKACAVVIAMTAAMVYLAGCRMGEAPAALKAQSATTYIYLYEGATANFGNEFVSLAQSNETGGTENSTASPTVSPTVTTDTDAALDIPVNKTLATPASLAPLATCPTCDDEEK